MIAPETAGDPTRPKKWVRSSLRQLSRRLTKARHTASPPTVGRLLKKLGYSLQANVKTKEAGQHHPDRDQQFHYIQTQRQRFQAQGWPIISVDTKKKELVGDFKNPGQVWCQQPALVNVHDFRQEAAGRAVPYGIYDLTLKRGSVYVGASADTAEFAVQAIARWWKQQGRAAYPQADQLLILADAGGSNGCALRLWKEQLQQQLSNRLGLTVTVCHYPTGCSKWNPIEHRLFSHISLNWAGQPLRTFQTMLACIRGTTTAVGLTVKAYLLEGVYQKGRRVSDAVMKQLDLEPHSVCPKWNYTIRPQQPVACPT
jgi:hypothetical protein